MPVKDMPDRHAYRRDCNSPTAENRLLNIPVSSFSFATADVRIAKEMGLFEKHGLDARIVQMDSANANPDLMKKIADDVADVGKAVMEKPDAVKAAVGKLYPDLNAETIELLFSSESQAWSTRSFSADDMAHEIAFVKSTGTALPQIDSVKPIDMIYQPK